MALLIIRTFCKEIKKPFKHESFKSNLENYQTTVKSRPISYQFRTKPIQAIAHLKKMCILIRYFYNCFTSTKALFMKYNNNEKLTLQFDCSNTKLLAHGPVNSYFQVYQRFSSEYRFLFHSLEVCLSSSLLSLKQICN